MQRLALCGGVFLATGCYKPTRHTTSLKLCYCSLQVNFQTKVYHPVSARGTPLPVQVVLHAAVLHAAPQPSRVARPSGCPCPAA